MAFVVNNPNNSRLNRDTYDPKTPFRSQQLSKGVGKSVRNLGGNNFATSAGMYAASKIGEAAVERGVEYVTDKISNAGKGNGKGNQSGKKRSRSRAESMERNFTMPVNRGSTSVMFTSPIQSGIITDPFDINRDHSSSLYLLCGSFLPTDGDQANSIARSYFNNDIFHQYILDVQSAVSYKADAEFTATELYLYFSSVIKSLELYYYMDSIIAYCNNPTNTNPGLRYIRERFSAQSLSDLARLQQYLETMPIPPNLLNTVRFFYQNFTSTEGPEANVFRLSPSTITQSLTYDLTSEPNVDSLSGSYFDDLISSLTQNSRVAALLRKTYPSMVPGTMPLSSPIAIQSDSFETFYFNSSSVALNATDVSLSDSVTNLYGNRDSSLPYFKVGEGELDGFVYALTNAYLASDLCFQPGLWAPLNRNQLVGLNNVSSAIATSVLYVDQNSIERLSATGKSTMCGIRRFRRYSTTDSKFINDHSCNPRAIEMFSSSINRTIPAVAHSMHWLFERPGAKLY